MAATRTAVDLRDVDDRIREALHRGDRRAAFVAMMSGYGEAIYRHCARLLRDPTLASDVQQAAFEQAYRDLPTLQDTQRIRGWLFRIATHRALDAAKRRRRFYRRFVAEEHGPAPEAAITAPTSLENAEAARALEDCLSQLEDRLRATVLLRFKEEMSYEEMAEVLDEQATTLRKRVARALPVLKRCLEGKGVTA
jgi:RNA polymerase sigma-70 factor (ECF subfamily)